MKFTTLFGLLLFASAAFASIEKPANTLPRVELATNHTVELARKSNGKPTVKKPRKSRKKSAQNA